MFSKNISCIIIIKQIYKDTYLIFRLSKIKNINSYIKLIKTIKHLKNNNVFHYMRISILYISR